jgi:hypothetical protein
LNSYLIDDNGVVAYTIDLDLNKSVTDPQSGDHYKLRPTTRVVENGLAGTIAGTVSGIMIAGLDGEQGCAVHNFDAASP